MFTDYIFPNCIFKSYLKKTCGNTHAEVEERKFRPAVIVYLEKMPLMIIHSIRTVQHQ